MIYLQFLIFLNSKKAFTTIENLFNLNQILQFHIKKNFNYFAKLPGINVVSKKYNISKVTYNVYTNTAFITWTWDGLEQPITARMTFIYRNNCIFQLHSSKLPDLNKSLLQISNLH